MMDQRICTASDAQDSEFRKTAIQSDISALHDPRFQDDTGQSRKLLRLHDGSVRFSRN